VTDARPALVFSLKTARRRAPPGTDYLDTGWTPTAPRLLTVWS